MYSQVDPDEKRYQLLDHITDHRKGCHAIELDDLCVKTKSGKKRMWQTTAGWDLLVQWKNGSKECVPLKILKNSNPIEVAEYAKSRGIDNQPAFVWWVPYTLRRRDSIVASQLESLP